MEFPNSFLFARKYFNSIALCFVAFTIPFGILFNNISIIIFILYTIFLEKFWKQLIPKTKPQKYIFWSYLLFFFIHFAGIAWSENKKEGFFELEKKLSFIIFPVFLLLNKTIDSTIVRNALWAFVAGCLVLVVACFASAFSLCVLLGEFNLDYFSRDMLVRNFSGFVHPTNLSWYLIFCILIIVNSIKNNLHENSFSIFVSWLMLSAIFVLTIFLLTSRLPIIYLVVLLFFLSYNYLKRKYGLFFGVALSALPIIMLFFIILNLNSFNVRFREISDDYNSLPYNTHHNSTNIRNACFLCSVKNISENVLIGTGTGDVQDKLTECYKYMNFSSNMYRDKYNSHNQYLQTAVGFGILGLFILINLFASITYVSYMSNSKILTSFIIMFSASCMTESMLGHQKGTVFFAFFSCLLINDSLFSKNNRNHFKE